MGSSERIQTQNELLAAAASWIASDLHQQTRMPGACDDAEAEMNDENLLDAARRFVAANEGVETIMGGFTGQKVSRRRADMEHLHEEKR